MEGVKYIQHLLHFPLLTALFFYSVYNGLTSHLKTNNYRFRCIVYSVFYQISVVFKFQIKDNRYILQYNMN